MVDFGVDFGVEVLINQLNDWFARMIRKRARENDVIHLKLINSFHSHEYGKS